ncbi:MAG: hypothetical protein FWH38_02970, partial [Treponema sp.]|nr:hypothetical protein [Treponema sp.]
MRNRNSVSIKPQRACKRAAVFFILALLPASCDLPQAPGRKGALSVALPGAHKDPRAIKLPGYLIEGMIYRLEFSGPGKTQSRTARSGDTVTLDLEPGRWRIEVDAFYLRPGTLEILIEEKTPLEEWFDIEFAVPAGKGSIDAEVIAGRQNQISIPLSVLDEFAVPGVGGYDASRVWAGGSVGAYLEEA